VRIHVSKDFLSSDPAMASTSKSAFVNDPNTWGTESPVVNQIIRCLKACAILEKIEINRGVVDTDKASSASSRGILQCRAKSSAVSRPHIFMAESNRTLTERRRASECMAYHNRKILSVTERRQKNGLSIPYSGQAIGNIYRLRIIPRANLSFCEVQISSPARESVFATVKKHGAFLTSNHVS
jgi:hypothetical protein